MGTLLTKNQLRRLPNYLHLLKNLKTSGMKYISCQTIADCLDLNKEQVRKDIALISSTDGVPNKGTFPTFLPIFDGYLSKAATIFNP